MVDKLLVEFGKFAYNVIHLVLPRTRNQHNEQIKKIETKVWKGTDTVWYKYKNKSREAIALLRLCRGYDCLAAQLKKINILDSEVSTV